MNQQLVVFLILLCVSSSSWAQNWQPLFDGHSFAGWMQQDGSSVTAPAWEATQGMLHLDRRNGNGGNLLSTVRYEDFELVFEWKIEPGGNNGLKYRVNSFDGRVLGLEYQMIDDHSRDLPPKGRTASLYDIYPPKEHDVLRPAGEFNRSRIVVFNNRIEHWLNGHLVTEAHVGSDEWDRRIANSKFANVDGFGETPAGHIMLTDHGDEVWYRNLFIRKLDATCVEPSARYTSGNGTRTPRVGDCQLGSSLRRVGVLSKLAFRTRLRVARTCRR